VTVLTAEQVQALIRAGLPMAEDIDLCIDRLDAQGVLARVPFHAKLVRPGGTLSGPTIMALADPGSDLPYVRAMWHYARAVGLANAGKLDAARAEVNAIAEIGSRHDFADLAAGGVPAQDVLKLAQHVASARIAQAEKDHRGAIAQFEAAVAVEDRLAYSEPPFWYYPTRQSLGAAHALAGNLDNAEQALRESLARTPNNGWALYGLMKVYEQRGDRSDARAAKKLLAKAWIGEPGALELDRL